MFPVQTNSTCTAYELRETSCLTRYSLRRTGTTSTQEIGIECSIWAYKSSAIKCTRLVNPRDYVILVRTPESVCLRLGGAGLSATVPDLCSLSPPRWWQPRRPGTRRDDSVGCCASPLSKSRLDDDRITAGGLGTWSKAVRSARIYVWRRDCRGCPSRLRKPSNPCQPFTETKAPPAKYRIYLRFLG
jgi:hypothetical protein